MDIQLIGKFTKEVEAELHGLHGLTRHYSTKGGIQHIRKAGGTLKFEIDGNEADYKVTVTEDKITIRILKKKGVIK